MRFFKVVLPQFRSFLNIKSFIIQFFMFVLSYTLYLFLYHFYPQFQNLLCRNPIFFTYFILNHYFLQVTDIHGVDVTPKPLYRPDPYSGTGKPNKLLTSQDGSHTSDFIASYSLYQNTINPSMLGQFTRQSILFYASLCLYLTTYFHLSCTCGSQMSVVLSAGSALSSQCATACVRRMF